VKTTIDLPEELIRRVKSEAALRGQKLRELVQEGIEYVLEHPAEKATSTTTHRFEDGFGIVKSGVGDLSSNPKHMEGFGRV
jgi:intracellular sulfur oxidation DsrE/DsrF family protein